MHPVQLTCALEASSVCLRDETRMLEKVQRAVKNYNNSTTRHAQNMEISHL